MACRQLSCYVQFCHTLLKHKQVAVRWGGVQLVWPFTSSPDMTFLQTCFKSWPGPLSTLDACKAKHHSTIMPCFAWHHVPLQRTRRATSAAAMQCGSSPWLLQYGGHIHFEDPLNGLSCELEIDPSHGSSFFTSLFRRKKQVRCKHPYRRHQAGCCEEGLHGSLDSYCPALDAYPVR